MREDGQRTCFTLGKTPGAERVLLWDDLEGSLKWGRVPGWGRPRSAKLGAAAFGGDYGLRMTDRRGIPNGPQFSGTGRIFPMVRDGILRVECVASVPVVLGLLGFGIAVEWTDGSKRYDVRVFYDDESFYFAWYGPRCGWVDTGLPWIRRAPGAWHRLWMEIDLVRKEFVNVGIDADTVQLDGAKICAVADAGPVVATVILFCMTIYTEVRSVHFDDVLVRTV